MYLYSFFFLLFSCRLEDDIGVPQLPDWVECVLSSSSRRGDLCASPPCMRKYATYAAMRRPRIGADLVVVSRGRLSSLSVARTAAAAPFKSSDRHDSAADHRLPTVELLSSEQFSVDQRPSPASLGIVAAHRLPNDQHHHPGQQRLLLRPDRVATKCGKSASNILNPDACLFTTKVRR